MPEEKIPELIMEIDTTGEKEKRTSKKNVDRRSTSSQDEKFRTGSIEKQEECQLVSKRW